MNIYFFSVQSLFYDDKTNWSNVDNCWSLGNCAQNICSFVCKQLQSSVVALI